MKNLSLSLMSALYILAGSIHFVRPDFYLNIMPQWLGYHAELVFLSGVCEVLLGLLLLFPATRRFAAWGIILLLVAVFPANVQMVLNHSSENNWVLWLAILRLPLQICLIYWAHGFTVSTQEGNKNGQN